MTVMITGASGLIGKELTKILDSKEINWIGLSRNTDKFPFIKTNYSVDEISEIMETYNVSQVVHLAAKRGRNSHLGYLEYQENECLLENVLRSMACCKVNRIVYLSSISVYSNLNTIPWNEAEPLNPTSLYGLSKAVGELLCKYYEKFGIKSLIFRCAHVLGFEDTNYMLNIFMRSANDKKQLTVSGKSLAKREFIYVKDVAKAIEWALLNQEINSVFNLGTGVGLTNYEVAKLVNDEFSNPNEINYLSEKEEGISSSLMDNNKLRNYGFKPSFSFKKGLEDIRKEHFN